MIRVRDAGSRDPARIVFAVDTDHTDPTSLWFETTLGTPPATPATLDVAAIALVPRAMAFGQDLHLEGRVSWSLLANLEEFVDVWTLWRPDLFRPVAITADEVEDDRGLGPGPLADRGVMAYSGGVDSTYSLVAAQQGARGRRSVEIVAGIQVHGLDIALDDHAAFAAASRSAAPILADLGTDHVCVRTNWHADLCPDWEMTHGVALAAVLHLFADRAGSAVVAADNTYDRPRMPWGQNPVTSPMLSSQRFPVRSSGAGTRRRDKCAAIGAIGSVRRNLRVCWEGAATGRNCGRCEKCTRTKLAFLATGHGSLEALGPLRAEDLATTTIGSLTALAHYEDVLDDLVALDADLGGTLAAVIHRERRRLEAAATAAGGDAAPPAPTRRPSPSAAVVPGLNGRADRWRRPAGGYL